jgi:transcriptional regulator with XRE-family HTH domain
LSTVQPWQELGQFIRLKRLQNHLTQCDLGETIGRSASEVSRWERGERRPKQPSMLELAKVFSVPVQVLQQKAGHTPEFDWYSSFAQAKNLGPDILLTVTD